MAVMQYKEIIRHLQAQAGNSSRGLRRSLYAVVKAGAYLFQVSQRDAYAGILHVRYPAFHAGAGAHDTGGVAGGGKLYRKQSGKFFMAL